MSESGDKIKTTHEKQFVEEPFLQQLETMPDIRWKVLRLDRWGQTEIETGRNSFAEVLMMQELEAGIMRLNPWLESDQLHDAVRDITTFQQDNLIVNNQKILGLLLQGTSADDRKNNEKGRTVRYIDFTNPANNVYTAVSEMRFRIPGTEKNFFPDIVLFVNGLPLVLVECKSPRENDALPIAIDQMMRYSEQRGYLKEGNRELFYYNQFIIATCRDVAKFGTITTHKEKYFYKWSDPHPFDLNKLSHGETSPNDQQRLVMGMLWQKNLLNIIQSFSIFTEDNEGNIIKVVGRYQQFRAVKKTIQKLLTGGNKKDRGGIIWHTQGSGKSLTMVFLIREMYQYTQLQSWKIILLTDRRQLDRQLKETGRNAGYTINDPKDINKLKEVLRNTNSEIVSAMIHKFQERDLTEAFPELNTSEKILVLTDEAHRSQYSLLGANLDKALPNATRIAFTGTPIERTKSTFGDYIDKYTMRQSVEDGVTLKIVYEGRVHDSRIKDRQNMDALFDDVFSECTLDEKLQVIGYGARQAYMESWTTIRAKAADMLGHFLNEIFPNEFKAQIVTCSKEAAHRYKISVDEELQAIREYFSKTPEKSYLSKYLEEHIKEMKIPDEKKQEAREKKSIKPSQVNLQKLRELEAAVIMSASNNDSPDIKKYADYTEHEKQIKSFKTPFGSEKDGVKGNTCILIVVEMLLTGFDAPVEQVMYLDRMTIAHNLLQAVARVNRVGADMKNCGFIIDYVGVGKHLKQALDLYFEEEDAENALVMADETELFKELETAHQKILEAVKEVGINDINDLDAYYDIFYDENVRFKFIEAYRNFMKALNDVFPRKEALDYVKDMLRFTEINVQAGRHLRDSRMSMRGVSDKLRVIADKHLLSLGIDEKVEPISILDEKFFEHIKKRKRNKTKAAEIEHAIRDHINIHADEDPELYASLSEALIQILQNNQNNWEEILRLITELRNRVILAEQENTYGLDRKKQMPLFRKFRKELFDNRDLTEDEITTVVGLTKEISEKMLVEVALTGFWSKPAAQNRLKAELQGILLSQEFGKLPNVMSKYNAIISDLMLFAKKNY
ncbi:MAG TPA: HsdR family type I site-specific deoxyribonuclease [Bacteroidia bacterium]|nr:HsdR family type I site-specific deoxyribonuclease [Bacteroidia bacterium]